MTGYYLIASSSTYAFEMGDIAGDGGESPVSGSSIADFQHGLDGVERVWKFMFADAVRAKDHFKAEEIDDQIAALHGLLRCQRAGSDSRRASSHSEATSLGG